jgi:hypothetical protein
LFSKGGLQRAKKRGPAHNATSERQRKASAKIGGFMSHRSGAANQIRDVAEYIATVLPGKGAAAAARP